jgi:hypothetical protein
MLKILDHNGNANQKDSEISSPSSQNTYHQEHKYWQGWEKRNTYTLLVGI